MNDSLLTQLADLAARMRPTPLLKVPHDRVDLVMKLESSNPSGSTKDRPAYTILEDAIRRGLVEPGSTVIESSSGNFALSLLMFCRYLGLRFIPVIDPTINAPTERLLRLGCERVEKVSGPGCGHLSARIDRVQQLRVQEPWTYWPNQYANPAAAQGHYQFTGAELCDAVPGLEFVFVGVGTGASLAGISQRVKQCRPRAKVVAVDADGSVIFGGPEGRRRIPGIGSTIRPSLVNEAIIDEVVVVPERDTVASCRRLARDTGLLVGGSTGSVVAAVDQYFDGYRGPRPKVAVLCADRGSAYTDTIYSDEWVSAELDLHQLPSVRTAFNDRVPR